MYGIGMIKPEREPTAGALLWRLTNKWRAAVDKAVAPLGLTHAQYSLLATLYGQSLAGAKPSQRELADVSGMEPIYVSKLARALEQNGLVRRSTHPGDPRAVQLEPTPRGIDTAREAVAIVRSLHEQLTASIGGPKSERYGELVHTLRDLLGDQP